MSTKVTLKYERDEAAGGLFHLYREVLEDEYVYLEFEGVASVEGSCAEPNDHSVGVDCRRTLHHTKNLRARRTKHILFRHVCRKTRLSIYPAARPGTMYDAHWNYEIGRNMDECCQRSQPN
jgi:hypothetical protein